MKLIVLGSGSKGNCYLFQNESECLILEAGVPFKEVLLAAKGNIRKVVGCMVTHEHQDHAKYVKEYIEHGIKVWMTPKTKAYLLEKEKSPKQQDLIRRLVKVLMPNDNGYNAQYLGNFTIQPYATIHDAVEPCGFFFHHPETGNVAFATDTSFVPNTFYELTNLLIECNYDNQLLEQRTDIPETLKQRIRDNHQSIDTCISAVKANTKGTLHQVILIHISEGDGDIENFEKRVLDETGIKTATATKGATFNITQYPF